MVHSAGYRAKTRDLFQRPFRGHGANLPLTTYLKTIKLGDYVDIVGNGAIHKGMPHKYYHGKTGIVWNVTPHAIGVLVNKQVGPKIIRKKIHVRIEHVRLSRCKEEFLKRVESNQKQRLGEKASGSKKVLKLKRQPIEPRVGHIVKAKHQTIEKVA